MKPFRWWQAFSRALFHLRLAGDGDQQHTWSADARLWGDWDGEVSAHLYRDGTHEAQSKLPAAFPVHGGVIEVVASGYGLKRCHFVAEDGTERQLTPDPVSAEGLRARLDRERPKLSRTLGVVSLVVLLVALVLGVPQLIEQITQIPFIADTFGAFTSPIHLPAWLNIGLVMAAVLASVERALRLRYNWLLDGGLFEGDE